MGTDGAPLLANIYLHIYEFEFMKYLQKTDLKLAREFNKTCCYIDDLATINNLSFAEFIPRIYPDPLKLNK